MIKIIKTETLSPCVIRLFFSDHSQGDYDFSTLLAQNTVLTQALQDVEFFKSHFLDLGALCWPNSLELSPNALYQELQNTGRLIQHQQAA